MYIYMNMNEDGTRYVIRFSNGTNVDITHVLSKERREELVSSDAESRYFQDLLSKKEKKNYNKKRNKKNT